MEELFLGAFLLDKKVDVVNEENIHRPIVVFEAILPVVPDCGDKPIHPLLRTDVGNPRAGLGSHMAFPDFPAGHEGENWTTLRVTDAFVASWLSDPDVEATALHELAHEELGHNDDPGYLDALAKDQAAGIDHHRGPWEIEADSLAAAYVEQIRDQMTDADRSLGCLETDAARYA